MSLGINAILGPEIGATASRDKGFSLTGALMPPSPESARVAVGIVLDAIADLHEALIREPTEAQKREAQQRERDKAEQARQDQVKKDQERLAQEVLERLGPNGAKLFAEIRGLPPEQRLAAINSLMVGITAISIAEQSARADGIRPANGFEPSEEKMLTGLETAKHRLADKAKYIGTIVLNDLSNTPDADDRRKMTGESVSLVSGDAKLALPLGGDEAPRITITGPITLDKSVRLKNNKSGQLTASAQDDEIYGHADVTLEYADGRSTFRFTGMRLKFSKDSVFRAVENPDNLSKAA